MHFFMTLQAENMIEHRNEIYSRPKRTWFATEKEKKLVAKAAKVVETWMYMESSIAVWTHFSLGI